MEIHYADIYGDINNVLTIEGYVPTISRSFKTVINIVDNAYDTNSEQYMLIKYNNKLYCIETTLINMKINYTSYKNKLDYNKYKIPVNVYIAMIGSIITDL